MTLLCSQKPARQFDKRLQILLGHGALADPPNRTPSVRPGEPIGVQDLVGSPDLAKSRTFTLRFKLVLRGEVCLHCFEGPRTL